MKMLVHIVKGTDREEILDAQIEKVNAARGLQAGQPGALSKQSLTQPINEKKETIADKIKYFSFVNNDGPQLNP